MAATITVTYSNETGFPIKIPAPATEPVDPTRMIKQVFEGTTFSVDISFAAEVDDGTGAAFIPAPITDVVCDFDFASIGLTFTKLTSSSVRISGTMMNAFTDSSWTFRMPDGSLKVLPPTTTEEFYSLVEYKMPSKTSTENLYSMTLTVEPEPPSLEVKQDVVVELNQWTFWSPTGPVEVLKSLVARGK